MILNTVISELPCKWQFLIKVLRESDWELAFIEPRFDRLVLPMKLSSLWDSLFWHYFWINKSILQFTALRFQHGMLCLQVPSQCPVDRPLPLVQQCQEAGPWGGRVARTLFLWMAKGIVGSGGCAPEESLSLSLFTVSCSLSWYNVARRYSSDVKKTLAACSWTPQTLSQMNFPCL